MKTKITTRKLVLGTLLAFATPFALPTALRAADHGDGPTASLDRACDIGDLYFFVDTTDATKVVLIGTVQGFIVPSEANNFSVFDPNVRYVFAIANAGDGSVAKPYQAAFNKFITITFSPRVANTSGVVQPQMATIHITGIEKGLTAPTTIPTLDNAANPLNVTSFTAPNPTLDFFAGEVDDPFFFDIVGFNRFVTKKIAGDPTAATELTRGRDSFAGYNTLAIAVRVPISLLKAPGSTSPKLGANFQTQRHLIETPTLAGTTVGEGGYRTIDRVAIPAVNVALIPFNRKNRYNAASVFDDKNGAFKTDIIASLAALGASANAIAKLANVAVSNGDILRLDTSTPSAGFPNGRRLEDDVIDTILGIIAGGTLGDGVSANDVPFQNVFPYLALPHQPLATGVLDDGTRN